MEKFNYLRSLGQQRQQDETIKETRKEITKELSSDYGGYQEIYGNNIKELFKKLKTYGVKVRKLSFLMMIRSKITNIKKHGLAVGSFIAIGSKKHAESTATHEVTHVKQYKENTSFPFFKGIIGFINFGIREQGRVLKRLQKSRKKYGKKAASRLALNNTSMEFEAYFYEGDITYLEQRKPFAYKQFETKEGRSRAVISNMDKDIEKRLLKAQQLKETIKNDEEITEENAIILNIIIEELIEEARKILEIQDQYDIDDRELISTFETPKGPIVWLESEVNRDKRLQIVEKNIEKEDKMIQELKKDEEIKILTSKTERDEIGIIKIQAKDGYNDVLLERLQKNKEIEKLHPNMEIIDRQYKRKKSEKYIRISFTESVTF